MSYADSETYPRYHHDVRTIIADDISTGEKGFARGPVRALMAALLFDGVQAYLSYVIVDGGIKFNSRYREAYNWVHSQGNEYIFSFESVCEGLGIDPNFLRLGLANVLSSSEQWKRARRNF